MGQSNGTPVTGRRKSIRSVLRSPFPRKRITQGNLSATFYYSTTDSESKIEQLNVNTATEEELMTLPGITRVVAQKIVQHRQVIGRFNKVEDLALVSGVGAEKLDQIKPEICVRQRSNASVCSRAASVDSLASEESNSGQTITTSLIDINKASVFTLMTVRGINQELAANIVDDRERRGSFLNFDDLLKVKGMNQYRLSYIRPYLLVCPPSDESTNATVNNNHENLNNKVGKYGSPFYMCNGRTSERNKININNLVHVKDIYELLSSYSPRPIADVNFTNMRNGQPALRIASWNLYSMSIEKADNLGVREVICRTILENKFSLVAVQDVGDIIALERLCSELNEPKLRRILEWKSEIGQWKYTYIPSSALKSKSGIGFLYDSSVGLHLIKTQVEEDSHHLMAVVAEFKVKASSITMMNVYVLDNCERRIDKIIQSNAPEVLLGDFTPVFESDYSSEGSYGYMRILPIPTITNSVPANKINFSDNIFLHKSITTKYTGVSGVVRQGLTHLGIPRGWSWGGPASEHCPVWCELFI